jgi:NAD(P)H-dependent flavin oxidoreductase YrpB (nitropropane dioxygenase family)
VLTASDLPPIIQGGMGVGVSSCRLASEVSRCGQLGVISGVALDLVLSRRLQDGDLDGSMRRAMAAFPDQGMVERILTRFFREGGRSEGKPYTPIAHLTLKPHRATEELIVVGAFVEVWLAKEGHDGLIGINCLEKIQMLTPATLLGAMIAGVDVVLMGAGVPREIPRLLNCLAAGDETIVFPIDVQGADEGQFHLELKPRDLLGDNLPVLERPVFLAIVSAHVLAAYLAREEEIRPDGFIVEASPAGGHNAPPRRPVIDDNGEMVFGPRDEPDLAKIAAVGLPFWVAGAAGTPEALRTALAEGARGVQVGTAFALCTDSGLEPEIRDQLVSGVRDGSLHVRTDPLASPTGFPFKVAEIPGTLSELAVYESRPRLCDLGFLRTPYVRDDNAVGYRCASEPVHMYVKKHGELADTVGRQCICNGLSATVGIGQTRKDGYAERPIVTLGADRQAPRLLADAFPDGWSAKQVVTWLLTG